MPSNCGIASNSISIAHPISYKNVFVEVLTHLSLSENHFKRTFIRTRWNNLLCQYMKLNYVNLHLSKYANFMLITLPMKIVIKSKLSSYFYPIQTDSLMGLIIHWRIIIVSDFLAYVCCLCFVLNLTLE